jgi:hypothetical protein
MVQHIGQLLLGEFDGEELEQQTRCGRRVFGSRDPRLQVLNFIAYLFQNLMVRSKITVHQASIKSVVSQASAGVRGVGGANTTYYRPLKYDDD